MEKVEFGKALFHIKTQTCVILIKQNVKREINAITRSQNKWKFLKTIWDYYMALLLQFYRGETEAQRSRLHQIVSHRLRLASVPGTSRSDLSGTLLRAGQGFTAEGQGFQSGLTDDEKEGPSKVHWHQSSTVFYTWPQSEQIGKPSINRPMKTGYFVKLANSVLWGFLPGVS